MKNDKLSEQIKFDVRLLEWNLKQGLVREEDVKDHTSRLPDTSEKVTYTQIDDFRNQPQ